MYEYTFENLNSGELLPIFASFDEVAWSKLDNPDNWRILYKEYVD